MRYAAQLKPITNIDIDNYKIRREVAKQSLRNCSEEHEEHYRQAIRTYTSALGLMVRLYKYDD